MELTRNRRLGTLAVGCCRTRDGGRSRTLSSIRRLAVRRADCALVNTRGSLEGHLGAGTFSKVADTTDTSGCVALAAWDWSLQSTSTCCHVGFARRSYTWWLIGCLVWMEFTQHRDTEMEFGFKLNFSNCTKLGEFPRWRSSTKISRPTWLYCSAERSESEWCPTHRCSYPEVRIHPK